MMKVLTSALSLALCCAEVAAFQAASPTLSADRCFHVTAQNSRTSLFSTTAVPTTATDFPGTSSSRKSLIEKAEQLKSLYGVFLLEKSAKAELKEAVSALENLSEPPRLTDDFLGVWELVCTTVTSQEGIDTSNLPAFLEPLQQIRDSVTKSANKYVKVEQVITRPSDGSLEIDRVDHVIEYMPPKELADVLDNLPEQLKVININPLAVSKSKLVLIHKAIVESTQSPLKVSLSLKSVVLNVAGTSTFLDPNGKDITGINIPLGDLLNAGSFETTYMDDELRISRGKTVAGDQLRVFMRKGRVDKDLAVKDIKDGVPVGKGVNADLDVDEFVDPDFENLAPSDVEDTDDAM